MSDPCEGRHDLLWDSSHGGFAYCRNCNWASLDPIRKDYTMTDQGAIEGAKRGDWIRAKYKGYPFEGEAWGHEGSDSLYVGPGCFRSVSGESSFLLTDIEVTPPTWPEGTVLTWVQDGDERVGIAKSNGYVRISGETVSRDKGALLLFDPIVLRLGGTK